MRTRIIGLVGILIVFASSGALSQTATWSLRGPMPVENSEFSTVLVNGRIYSVGGFKVAHHHKLYIYNPKKDSWSRGADLPHGVHHSGVATVKGRVYVIAGTAGETRRVQIYDPAADSWSQGTDMPTARTALAVAVLNGKIHAMGGSVGIGLGQAKDAHEVYDPVTDTWEERAPLPVATEHVFAVVLDGKIYVVAGRNGLSNRSDLQIYNAKTDSWSPGASLPLATSGMAVQLYKKKIYVFGGEDLAGGDPVRFVLDEVQRYDPNSNSWQEIDVMPEGLHGVASAVVGDSVYLFGGSMEAGSGDGTDLVLEYAFPASKLKRPNRLKAQATAPTRVQLSWRDRADTETSYQVQMKSLGGKFKTVATVGSDTEQTVIAGLTAGTTYLFRVRARAGTKKSKWSKKARATTPN